MYHSIGVVLFVSLLAGVVAWVPTTTTTTITTTTRLASTTQLGLAKKRPRGFGSSTTNSKSGFSSSSSSGGGGSKQAPVKKTKLSFDLSKCSCITDVLNRKYTDNPEVLKDIGVRLQRGEVVILKDAFVSELATAMHEELSSHTVDWDHNEDYFPDGYHYRHSNIYNTDDFPPLCKDMNDYIFNTPATKEWISNVSGRDCVGTTIGGAPSYYGPGDHSLPHTDHIGQRSVAYVWHLSQNWKPEWGGALYWAQEPLANAFHHASFNSLVLFSVTPLSSHFVTTVSPLAKEKRLAYNGWWHAEWIPTPSDPLEDLLATPQQRLTLTHAQILALNDMLDDPWAPRIQPPERHEQLETLRTTIMEELYPPPLSSVPTD